LEEGRKTRKEEEWEKEVRVEIYANHAKFLNKPKSLGNISSGKQSCHRAYHLALKQGLRR